MRVVLCPCMRWRAAGFLLGQNRMTTGNQFQRKGLPEMKMPVAARAKKNASQRRAARRAKLARSSLHGHAIEVSVDERLEDLERRYPALVSSLGPLILNGKKRIRDFPPSEQERILRMVFALKKASGG